MTHAEIRAAGTKTGRDHAIADGRAPAPWLMSDLAAANAEMHRLSRLHRIDLYAMPRATSA